jgi:hypothetical protein
MRVAFDRRGRIMHEMLAAIPGVACIEPQGAFYCFPSFEGVLGRELAGRTPTTTLELCELLLDEAKVAIVPGEAFDAPGYARLSYALGDDDLGEGVASQVPRTDSSAGGQMGRVLCREAGRADSAMRRGTRGRRALGLSPASSWAVHGAAALVIRLTGLAPRVLERAAACGWSAAPASGRRRRRRHHDPTRRMVGNPQSTCSRPPSARSRCCSRRPATSPADRDLRDGRGPFEWEGVELHDKVLGIVGLGSVGVLIAQRVRHAARGVSHA